MKAQSKESPLRVHVGDEPLEPAKYEKYVAYKILSLPATPTE